MYAHTYITYACTYIHHMYIHTSHMYISHIGYCHVHIHRFLCIIIHRFMHVRHIAHCCVHIRTYRHTYIHHICMYLILNTGMYTHMHTSHMYEHPYITCIKGFMYIHIHISHIHTYIHTYIHISYIEHWHVHMCSLFRHPNMHAYIHT
jgi:hypothetical protein